MEAMELEELREVIDAEDFVYYSASQTRFSSVSTDSRTIEPGSVFFALRGEVFDGHDYVAQAARAGALAVVVDHFIPGVEVTQLVVKDVLEAYGQLASKVRMIHGPFVVMVVGSNGKTTTKDMMADVLEQYYGYCSHATRGNLNNNIGVPRTLIELGSEHRAAVVEAGINHRGEMAQLARWVQPDMVIVTNAQREHQEFLDSVRESARENGLAIVALRKNGIAVIPADDPQCDVWRDLALARGVRVVTYSTNPDIRADFNGFIRDGFLIAEGHPMVLRDMSAHTVHNALAVYAAASMMGLRKVVIENALQNFNLPRGRGARYKLPFTGLVVVDEAYNANPDSVRATMKALSESPVTPKAYVLGDMAEVGQEAEAVHREVGRYARELGIDRLITVGRFAALAAEAFGEGAQVCRNVEEALRAARLLRGIVTIKASHCMGFERLVNELTER